MDANIRQQDIFHRRGLLLGLTMAEIMILILFCLLLLFGVQKLFFEKQIEQRDAIIKSAIKDGKIEPALAEAIPTLVRQKPADRSYNDYFSELIRSGQELDKEKAQREKLSKELVQAKSNKAELEKELAKTKAELASANEKLASANIPPDDTLADAKSFQEIAKAFPKDTPRDDVVAWVKKAKENEKKYASLEPQLVACEEQKDTLFSQNAAMRRKCLGSEKPSCWYDSAGLEEFIFDVALTSTGLVAVDRKLPHRAAEQAQLPISGVVFGNEVTDSAFLSQAKPIFNWSESHDCRFFVRIFDFTKPGEKELYKHRARIVGQRFYFLERKKDQFPLQEGSWTERPPKTTTPKRVEPTVPADTATTTGAVVPDGGVATPAPAASPSTPPESTMRPQKKAGDGAAPPTPAVPAPPAKDTGNPFQMILDFLKSGTSQ